MNLADLPPRPGCHVTVVGGGPSATKYYDKINTTNPVIAPSTMLIPLQAAGIYPDVVCCMDPSAVMPLHFKGCDTSKTLVYLPSIIKRCYQDWTGPKYAVWALDGSSVLFLCIQVAMQMQAAQVTLVGADFNYGTERSSHAAGVPTSYTVSERSSVKVKNGRGEEVLSECSLREYAGELEMLVAKRQDVKWIRAGRDGIPVAGCEIIE